VDGRLTGFTQAPATFEEALAAFGGDLPDMVPHNGIDHDAAGDEEVGSIADTEELMGATWVDDSEGAPPGMSTVDPVEAGSDD
jgi:hypothetical protein